MKHPQSDLVSLLRRSSLFHDVPPAELAQLASATHERRYIRGAMIFQKGDRPTGLYIVVSGKIKEFCQSPEGAERIIEVLGPDQTCGESALFHNAPYPCCVAALTNALLLHIDKTALDRMIDQAPGVAKQILSALSLRMLTVLRDIESYSQHTPVQRIIAYLIELTEGSEATDVAITLPAAKFVIASRLGITPEALSRAFRDLAEAGLLEVRGSRITVPDMARLSRVFAK